MENGVKIKRISLVFGAGNMLSVCFALAENLRVQGVIAVFVSHRNGRYESLWGKKQGFPVKFVDRIDTTKIIKTYYFHPISNANEIDDGLPPATFYILPFEELGTMDHVDLVCGFTSVGAGNIATVIEKLKCIKSNIFKSSSVLPVYLFENLSSQKAAVLNDFNDDSVIKLMNCVIRRTSSDWRLSDGGVCINTRSEGEILYSTDNKVNLILLPEIDNVKFIRQTDVEINTAEAIKFFGTNCPDFLIARYLYLKKASKESVNNLENCSIGSMVTDSIKKELEDMVSVIDFVVAARFGVKISSSNRIEVMCAEKFGRILKCGKAAQEKLDFCCKQTTEFLLIDDDCQARFAGSLARIRYGLGLRNTS